MYCYFPDRRYGTDKIARVENVPWIAWDLVGLDGIEALILGDECAFSELQTAKVRRQQGEVLIPTLLSTRTITWATHLVQERYGTYHTVLPLFLGQDLMRHGAYVKAKKTSPALSTVLSYDVHQKKLSVSNTRIQGQQLIVFPDLWTMHQYVDDYLLEKTNWILMYGWLSTIQQTKLFRRIKTWAIQTVYTTHGCIFQDRPFLCKVIVIDAHKRWYKSSQDPRYRTPTVLKQLMSDRNGVCEIYGYLLDAGVAETTIP